MNTPTPKVMELATIVQRVADNDTASTDVAGSTIAVALTEAFTDPVLEAIEEGLAAERRRRRQQIKQESQSLDWLDQLWRDAA